MKITLHAVADFEGRFIRVFMTTGQINACAGAKVMRHTKPDISRSMVDT
ncbi:hypothetical protein [Ruegeria atlantica]|nr:hypothetical protein [Ruegeria atlantica]